MKKAFTLIELLIVIAIIGILSSIVLVSLGGGRTRANHTAALSTASSILKIVQMCDIDGGIIGPWSSDTNGGGSICSLGSRYGTWPPAPDGFSYNGRWINIYNGEQNNMFRMWPTGSTTGSPEGTLYCGHYQSTTWTTSLTDGRSRVVNSYGCTQRVGDAWK